MQKTKKWTALLCAAAVLVTLLVPMNSLAAEEQAAVLTEEQGIQEQTAAAGISADIEGRAASPAVRKANYSKDENGETAPTSTLQAGAEEAVVLVNDDSLELDLSVIVPGATGYTWSRLLSVPGPGDRPVTDTSFPPLDDAQNGEPTYTVSVANGDMQKLGTYTYTCQIEGGDFHGKKIPFVVRTVGADLVPARDSAETVAPMLVSAATAGNPNLMLQVNLDREQVNTALGEINLLAEDGVTLLQTIAAPKMPRGRGVYEWKSAQLGSSFDVYPYDKSDDAGAFYNDPTTEEPAGKAWFQLLVAYDGGTTYANQVVAGENTYTCTATGAGINPDKNEVTFTRTVIPQLVPQPETDGGYEATVAGNTATYTYYTPSLSVEGRVLARWQMSLVPGSGVQYKWTSTDEGETKTETTGLRSYDFEIQCPASKTVNYVCEPVGTMFDGLSDANKAQVRAVFDVKIQKDVPAPEIKDLTAALSNGESVRIVQAPESTQAWQVSPPQGNELILTADAAAGTNVGGVLRYQWTLYDANHASPTVITATNANFALEEDGAQLRILNPQQSLDRCWIRLTVTNRGNKETYRDIQLLLGAPRRPSVELSSDPADSNGWLTLSAGAAFKLQVAELNGISTGSLSYEWLRTTAAKYDDPDVWEPVPKATSVNPLALTATRTLNDVPTYYKCVVTNTSGKADTLQAETGIIGVEVNPTTGVVTITEPKQEIYKEIDHGSANRVVFGVEAKTDTGAKVGFQWYVTQGTKGKPAEIYETNRIEGATDSSYTPGRIPEPGYYVYKCKVYNVEDPTEYAWSPEFQLNVVHAQSVPVVTTVGETKLAVFAGGYVRMRVEAYSTSGEVLSYQWEQSQNGSAWTNIPDGNGRSLTVSNMKTTESGTQYRCRVTNLRQDLTNYSDPFTVSVWRLEDKPEIKTQPKGWTLQSGTSESAHPTLFVDIARQGTNRYVFNWERWDADTDSWVTPDLEQLDLYTDDSVSSTLEFPNNNEHNGRYRCQIINRGGTPADATIYTNEVEVRVMMRSVPTILSAPRSQSAMVGKTVSLRVNATVFPEDELLYTWRVREPGSSTWRNCDGRDGAGYNSPIFTSKAYTGSDIGQKYEYYCVVEGAASHVRAPESTRATITVYPEYPELDPAPTSKLEIKEDEETGERLLRGYVASRTGLVLTVKGLQEDLVARNMDGTGGKYTLEVRDPQGNLLKKADDPVTTGCTVSLILTNEPGGEPVTADEVTVVILGDVQGTGRMSIGQLVAMANHLIGDREIPAGPRREAVDINNNGKCDIGDLTTAAQLLQMEP